MVQPIQSQKTPITVISRRHLLRASALGGLIPLLYSCGTLSQVTGLLGAGSSPLTFTEVNHGVDEQLHVPPAYQKNILLRWGDPVFADVAEFNPNRQRAQNQARQCGYNSKVVAFIEVPSEEQNETKQGVLVLTHENTEPKLMFPNINTINDMNSLQINVDMMAHGVTVVGCSQNQNGDWVIDKNSPYNRRITPKSQMAFSGPAKGAKRLKGPFSNAHSTTGTCANADGCMTPWGTVLITEKNFQRYFFGTPSRTREKNNYAEYGVTGIAETPWYRVDSKWKLSSNSLGALHLGWVFEIDPLDATSRPVKHTALGRCHHGGCSVHVDKHQHIVSYTCDADAGQYIYRFVSSRPYEPNDAKANSLSMSLGTLSVARISNKRLTWIPLEHGEGELTRANGFRRKSDVVIDLRRAASLSGATPMDNPSSIQVDPHSGRVFVVMAGNNNRNTTYPAGHILELTVADDDHSAESYRWDNYITAGKTSITSLIGKGGSYGLGTTNNGWFANPTHASIDNFGRMWISTDGMPESTNLSDGVWVTYATGKGQAVPRHFLRSPIDASVSQCALDKTGETLFAGICHPGKNSNFANPSSRWPDFQDDLPPRPSVIAVRNQNGTPIGT